MTSAGYLPPSIVSAVFTDLAMGEGWIGKGNREDLTPPVLELRESAQQLGLIRKYRGRLTPTKAANAVHDNPVGLWRHLAGRLMASARSPIEQHACALYLLAVATDRAQELDSFADLLNSLGWMRSDSTECTPNDLLSAAHTVTSTMETLGLLRWNRAGGSFIPTTGAAEFARGALGDLSR